MGQIRTLDSLGLIVFLTTAATEQRQKGEDGHRRQYEESIGAGPTYSTHDPTTPGADKSTS